MWTAGTRTVEEQELGRGANPFAGGDPRNASGGGRFRQQPFGFGGGGFRARQQREATAEERAEMERQAEEFRQAARTVAKEVGKAVMGAAARAAARAARNAASNLARGALDLLTNPLGTKPPAGRDGQAGGGPTRDDRFGRRK